MRRRIAMPEWAGLTLNAVGYQSVWAAAVLGAGAGHALAGPAAAAVFIVSQWALSPVPRRDLLLVGASAALGMAVDSAQAAAGLFAFQAGIAPAWLCPPWLLAIWAAFGTTLNGCMRWLKGRPWLGVAVGAVGGPLAYWAGVRLGAITLQAPLPVVLAAWAAVWAAVLPVLAAIAARLGERGKDPAVDPSIASPSSDPKKGTAPASGGTPCTGRVRSIEEQPCQS